MVVSEIGPRDGAHRSRFRTREFCDKAGVLLRLELCEPLGAFRKSIGLGVECRGPVQDLIVVYLENGKEIILSCVTEVEVHGGSALEQWPLS